MRKNSAKSFMHENPQQNVIEKDNQTYFGHSFKEIQRKDLQGASVSQNVQFSNYSTRGPTEAYTAQADNTLHNPQGSKTLPKPTNMIEPRKIVKKPPTIKQKRKSNGNICLENSEKTEILNTQRNQFNQLYDVKNQKTIYGSIEANLQNQGDNKQKNQVVQKAIQNTQINQVDKQVNLNQKINQLEEKKVELAVKAKQIGVGLKSSIGVNIEDQMPNRLESLIKQLIVRKQISVSPNFQIKRANGQNYFDENSLLSNEVNNIAHLSMQQPNQIQTMQQDVLSTMTAITQDEDNLQKKLGNLAFINNQHENKNTMGLSHKISAEDLMQLQKVNQQHFSETCQQSSPINNIKVTSGEQGVEKSCSKEIELESLINYQELLNSKDILGSSLPISQTLHFALSKALQETNSGISNNLCNLSQADNQSLANNKSPQRQFSVQEKQVISNKFQNNIDKFQQKFVSLDLQPKSIGSTEEIYEQTLFAFQKDLNQLHEIDQTRQEISSRIKQHQKILNRLHNVQQSSRGSFILHNQNAMSQVSQPSQPVILNQKGSLEIPPNNMSQIDFSHIYRAQNSVQPNFYDQRSHFVSTQMQQNQSRQNEKQYQSINPSQVNNIHRSSIGGEQTNQKLATSPKVGRYRLKGLQGLSQQPQQTNHQVYQNRVNNFANETKRTKSVRQRQNRQIIPLASTSIGGSNLRTGRKYVTTQQNSSIKGYGTIETQSVTIQPMANKKIQTGYLPMGSALTTFEPNKQINYQQSLVSNYATKLKSTTLVYGPSGYSSIGSNSNGKNSVPKQRQHFSNLRPALQGNGGKAGRSFSNRNRVIQQSLLNNNTSGKIARNTYVSIGSGSLTSQTGYHYGLQNSSIENPKRSQNSNNALETFSEIKNDDRSVSPNQLKSKTVTKQSTLKQHQENIPVRKGYKKSTSRGRGVIETTSSVVSVIRKHAPQHILPKVAQMSHQQVLIRDSLQNATNNSSIVRVSNNKPSMMRMSPQDQQESFTEQQVIFNSRVSPEKLRIIQQQQKNQFTQQHGMRQVRIRGVPTRNHFTNDSAVYNNDADYEMSGLQSEDFRVGGGQVIINANGTGNTNPQKDTHNLRYSRAAYDFHSNSYNDDQFDINQSSLINKQNHQAYDQISETNRYNEPELRATDGSKKQKRQQILNESLNTRKQPIFTEEKRRDQDTMMKLINEDNPFENPPQIIRSPVATSTKQDHSQFTKSGENKEDYNYSFDQWNKQLNKQMPEGYSFQGVNSIASKTTGISSAVAYHNNFQKQSKGRFNGNNSGARLSLLAAGAIRRSETTENSQQCKYLDGTMVMSSLPMPMQSINQIIAEEEAAAEQDEKTTNKESSTKHGPPASSKLQKDKSSSSPSQSEPTHNLSKRKSKAVITGQSCRSPTSIAYSVEDECLIGDSSSSYQERKVQKNEDSTKLDEKVLLSHITDVTKAFQEQPISRQISRASIQFAKRVNYQSNKSLKVMPQEEKETGIYVDSSNLFGVNLIEEHKKQIAIDDKSEQQSARSVFADSDGNLICESVCREQDRIEESGGMADVEIASGCDVISSDIFLKKSLKPKNNLQISQGKFKNADISYLSQTKVSLLQDFPPLLQTIKTHLDSNFSHKTNQKHSDDEVEVRRVLEESENALRSDIDKKPQLLRSSTRSLLKQNNEDHSDDAQSDIQSKEKNFGASFEKQEIVCETPHDLLVILGKCQQRTQNANKNILGETMEVFNDDVMQLDETDQQLSMQEYQRRLPRKNNFFEGRPTTANFRKKNI